MSVKIGTLSRRTKRLIFYSIGMAWPVAWFLIFYVYLNSSNIVQAFLNYDIATDTFHFYGFKNFVNVIKNVSQEYVLRTALKNSILVYLIGWIAGFTVGQVFSYYVYKKFPGTHLFKVMLFLPSIIPGIAFMLCFTYITDRLYPMVASRYFGMQANGLLSDPSTAFPTLVFFKFWTSYAGSTIIYSNAMTNNIDPSLQEAARLDGVNPITEYFYIVFPLIFPTMQIFIISDIGCILGFDLNLYAFYGEDADPSLYMVGYYVFKENLHATDVTRPYLAAMSLLIGIIQMPVVFVVKHFTDRYIDKTMGNI